MKRSWGFFVSKENKRLHDETAAGIQQTISELDELDRTVDPGTHVSRFSIGTFSERAQNAIAGWHADLQRRVRQ